MIHSTQHESNNANINQPQHSTTTSIASRLKFCLTLPHIVALLSVVCLFCHVIWIVGLDSQQELISERFAKKCAFVYFASMNQTNISKLQQSLTSLNKHFKTQLSYQLIVIHDHIPPVSRGKLQAASEKYISFRWVRNIQHQHQHQISINTNLSHTELFNNRFTSKPISQSVINWSVYNFVQLCRGNILSDVDYLIDLQPHAEFRSVVRKDFVQIFAQTQLQFAYHMTSNECDANIVSNLTQLTNSYIELNGIKPGNDYLWLQFQKALVHDCIPKFIGQFQVINLRFLRSHTGIQDWIRIVEKNYHMFAKPSCVQVLQFITMALYSATNKVEKYDTGLVPFHKLS